MEEYDITMEYSREGEDSHKLLFLVDGEPAAIVEGGALALLQVFQAGNKYLNGDGGNKLPAIHLN